MTAAARNIIRSYPSFRTSNSANACEFYGALGWFGAGGDLFTMLEHSTTSRVGTADMHDSPSLKSLAFQLRISSISSLLRLSHVFVKHSNTDRHPSAPGCGAARRAPHIRQRRRHTAPQQRSLYNTSEPAVISLASTYTRASTGRL